MRDALIFAGLIVLAGVILVHCVCVVSGLSRLKWQGHKGRFAGVSASIALLAGGALGMVLSFYHWPFLLAAGIAGEYVFDRRNTTC